jgi:hypothetical protein
VSKKTNTLLFILGGTVFNILITIISFFILILLFSTFLIPHLPENSGAWVMPVAFVLAIVSSFFLYRLAIKLLMKKVDIEKHFDPILGPRRPPRRRD